MTIMNVHLTFCSKLGETRLICVLRLLTYRIVANYFTEFALT